MGHVAGDADVAAGQRQIPEVGQVRQESDRILNLGALEPGRPARRVEAEAEGDGAGLADRLLGILQELAGQAQPLLQGAAVS
jgi:hypothetical protein